MESKVPSKGPEPENLGQFDSSMLTGLKLNHIFVHSLPLKYVSVKHFGVPRNGR